MRLKFLGTGTSHGIPVISCGCSVCRSGNPKNRRLRSSMLITSENGTNIVVDTGPDFRMQMLNAQVVSLDAVCITHPHADHLNGIDDLRIFTRHREMPIYADVQTTEEIRRRFDYIFMNPVPGGGKPRLQMHVLGEEPFTVGEIAVTPVPVNHGKQMIMGFRFGDMCYLTDCSGIPESSYDLLTGLEVLVIGALRYQEHPTHFSVEQALAAAQRIGAGRTFLTHICHDIDHDDLEGELPAGVSPAFDGLEILE